MTEAEFSIQTPTDNVLTLDQAVLLYHRRRSGGALATVHEVLIVDGAPMIGAAAMTTQAARELASALLQRAAHGGFPARDGAVYPATCSWVGAPDLRHIAFRVGDDHAESFGGTGDGDTVPASRTGLRRRQPWMAGGRSRAAAGRRRRRRCSRPVLQRRWPRPHLPGQRAGAGRHHGGEDRGLERCFPALLLHAPQRDGQAVALPGGLRLLARHARPAVSRAFPSACWSTPSPRW